MISNEIENQARKALADFEEAVCLALWDLEDLTERASTIDISHSLNFTTDVEVQIVKCILNKLKADGRVESMGDCGDAWQLPTQEK